MAKYEERRSWSKCFYISGIVLFFISIAWLLVLTFAPGNLLMRPTGRTKDHVPIIKKGNLVLYPQFGAKNPSVNGSYVIDLSDPQVRLSAADILNQTTRSYSEMPEDMQTDCYMEKPTYNQPCRYPEEWLGVCRDAQNPNFGYGNLYDFYNPCLLFRIEETGDWKPRLEAKKYMPEAVVDYYDPNFAPVMCYPLAGYDDKSIEIEVQTKKGFHVDFFPISSFDPRTYSHPAVAVVVKGIPEGQSFSVECGVLSEDRISLWNNGIIQIHFIFEKRFMPISNSTE